MSNISTAGTFAYRVSMPSPSAKSVGQVLPQANTSGPMAPFASASTGNTSMDANTETRGSSSIREALDAGYKALGRAPSDTVTGAEWATTVGFANFSREDLVGMMKNEGGEFTDREMDQAKMAMRDRISAVLTAAYAAGGDHAAAFKAAVDFLDQAGPNEMGTLSWAQERASAQKGYELVMKGNGLTPENVDSGNAIVALFLQGYDELSRFGDINSDVSEMPSYQKGISEWHARRETVAAYLG